MFDFCGIGNACIDIVASVDDAFLDSWKFPKGICTYLELGSADALEAALLSPVYIPGGCAANTAACITALGGSASFMGRVAQDKIGQKFLDDMKMRGIHYTGKPDTTEGAGSTRIFALITPDTERTFAAYYGVQEDLSVIDLDEDAIRNSKFLYLDGYALNSRLAAETFLTAAGIAKKAGRQVVFSPSDLSILKKYPDVVAAIMAVSDGMICNQNEADFLAQGEEGILGSADNIARLCNRFSFGAVTIGAQGAVAFKDGKMDTVPLSRKPPGAVVDTNGAGDAFTGGFLYGLAHGYDHSRAAELGNTCASVIITHAGARPIGDYKGLLS